MKLYRVEMLVKSYLISSGICWIMLTFLCIVGVDSTPTSKCPFCNGDFLSLNRHLWRCKGRVTSSQKEEPSAVPLTESQVQRHNIDRSINIPAAAPDTEELLSCVCGKQCKGRRGLRSHQRACKVHSTLSTQSTNENNNSNATVESHNGHNDMKENNCNHQEPVSNHENSPNTTTATAKPGLHLPQTKERWEEANTYFHSIFSVTQPIVNLNDFVQECQGKVYDYFAGEFGTVPNSESDRFKEKYLGLPVKALKKELHLLKSCHADVAEIQFVSKLIRAKIKKAESTLGNKIIEANLKDNFWQTCRQIFSAATNSLPTFSVGNYTKYLVQVLQIQIVGKKFIIPDWMPELPPAKHVFDNSPPSYKDIVSVINKGRGRASACPYDQLSILILKRCPFLRTLLHYIITECWTRQQIPDCWKHGATILIYKKGEPSDPANFRPITLQSVWYKVFATCVKNRMYQYLSINEYIDRKIQKGFWPRVDGVTEHTELLSHIMTDAKRNNRSLIVTLMDLKNAFGEIDHDLIRISLSYHHLPSFFANIFNDIYSGATISAAVNSSWSPHLKVERGVLQGDPWSPLLFNLCFNTLMQTLAKEELKHLGYIYGPHSSQRNCSWLQFADDAVIVSSNAKDAQLLLNIFITWCNWSKMTINLKKCNTFGMMKKDNVYSQIKPGLYYNNEKISSIPIGGYFTYLGKVFDFEMQNEPAKIMIMSKLQTLLQVAGALKVKSQLKLKILNLYIHSQLNFELRLYNLGSTWISQHMDSMQTSFIRECLDLPVSSCVKELSILPKTKGGLGIQSFKNISDSLWLRKRNSLKESSQMEIRQIWSESSTKYVRMDSLLDNSVSIAISSKMLVNSQTKEAEKHFIHLQTQGAATKSILENISGSNIRTWNDAIESLPQFLFQFAIKTLQQQLPTAANLVRWKKIADSSCQMCSGSKPQTNKHLLSNCSNPLMLEQYLHRHNEILKLFSSWIDQNKSSSQQLFTDLDSGNPISEVFHDSVRPDLILSDDSTILVLELTVCHETNLQSSKAYKLNKYKNISSLRREQWRNIQVKLFTLEISNLGFLSDLSQFTAAACLPNLPSVLKLKLIHSAINCSFNIYGNRNDPKFNIKHDINPNQ